MQLEEKKRLNQVDDIPPYFKCKIIKSILVSAITATKLEKAVFLIKKKKKRE